MSSITVPAILSTGQQVLPPPDVSRNDSMVIVNLLEKAKAHMMSAAQKSEALAVDKSDEPSGRRVRIRRFRWFKKLPLEIRRLIWSACAHMPREIQFMQNYGGVKVHDLRLLPPLLWTNNPRQPAQEYCTDYRRLYVRIEAGSRTPAILLVNKEARFEGLKYYEKPFGDMVRNGDPYLNFAVDTVHLHDLMTGEVMMGSRGDRVVRPSPKPRWCKCPSVTQEFKDLMAAKLQHLSVGRWEGFDPDSGTKFTLGLFGNLKTVTLGRDAIQLILGAIHNADHQNGKHVLGGDMGALSKQLLLLPLDSEWDSSSISLEPML